LVLVFFHPSSFTAGDAMKTKWFAATWLFIFAVAALDAGFAWVNRHSMTSWEMNPVMRMLAGTHGPVAAIAVRLLSVVFGVVVVAVARKIWRAAATGLIGGVHLMLLAVYARAVL
jgi:hypothetical protein